MKFIEGERVIIYKNVLKKVCLLCLLPLLYIGCSSIEDKNNEKIENNYPGLADHNTEWIKMLNSDSSLKAYYHSPAVMLFENNWYLKKENIENILHDIRIKKRTVHGIHKHSDTQIFEIGDYVLSDKTVITYLTAYYKLDDTWMRQLEVFFKKAENSLNREISDNIIKEKEQKWEKLISLKDADQLVEALFWKDARYFGLYNGDYIDNNKKLSEVYRFIESPDAIFTVRMLDHYVVRDDVIYIIGQYQSGTDMGRYTLIITKNEHGEWKNILDSNY